MSQIPLDSVLLLIGLFLMWILLTRLVLPRFGVPT